MKKIIIAGGSGFLGEALSTYFSNKGCVVITLSRKQHINNPNTHKSIGNTSQTIYWNGKTLGDWTAQLENAHVLINLAGKSVDCRYTAANKAVILNSRVDSTAVLHKAMAQATSKPAVWLNASTATIYTHAQTHLNTEENGIIGDDFSMNIAKSWEQEFFKTSHTNVRQVALRTSIVLGNNGGALPKMKLITKLGMGGKQGRGEQFISWIHITDFCNAIEFILESNLDGAINITAPVPERNVDFMNLLRTKMNIPIGISQPIWLLELGAAIIRTETELLLKSRNVYPQRLVDAGFTFNYPTVERCLADLI